MNTFQQLFSRQFYRTISFWLLFLISLYTVIGFLVLPNIINNVITEQVNKNLGWQTSIKKVEVNPFLFTLTINELAISENQKDAIAFSRFHADFELRSLIEGAFTFKNVMLVDPAFNLFIDQDGTTNIQQALAKYQLPEVTKTAEVPFVMPKLLFDKISVTNGSLSATDNSQKTIIKHQLNPISFNLDSFSTYVEKGGDYQLHISLGNDQSLDWSGQVSVAPVSSQGSFSIKGIKAHRLWPYIAPFSPYALHHTNVDVEANYALSYINSSFELALDDAFVTLNDIKIAIKERASEFIAIKQIKVGPTDFNLTEQRVAIKEINIDSFNLDLLKDADGELELLAPLDAYLAENKTKETSQPSSPFLWSIDNFLVNNSQVNFVDKSIQDGAEIKIHNIKTALSNLNQSLSNEQPFSLSYQIENSKQNSVSGSLIAQPFKLNSKIELSGIELKLIQPYLNELTNVEIDKGTLSLSGNANVSMHKKEGLKGKFKGDIAINDFDSQDTIINRRLLGWKKLEVTPIEVNLSPLAINIDKVVLNKPYSRLVISEDRKINLSQLMKNKKGQEATATQKAQQEKSQNASPIINIHDITIKSGSAYFADFSLRPQFGTSIQNMTGYIKGLSSNNLESADVKMAGTVEEYGKVLVEGKINPLSGELYTDINVNFDKIELTTLTPYAGRYAGYDIDKGKLSLALNYKIVKGMLDGNNRLILDQFELGDAVESEESLDLPLKLALALFKDSNGIIDINLPTKGNMNSPDFEISGLIMKTLLNVMTKAVTSPFSLLASLAGGDEQSLNSVNFELASSVLNQQKKDNLKTLAELLKTRPQLILEIRVNVDSEQENLILKQQMITKQLNLANKKQEEQITLLEQAITKVEGKNALTSLSIASQEPTLPEQDINQVEVKNKYRQRLFNYLVSIQPQEGLQLTELAQQRISVIKNELINVNKVDNSQIFALNPSLKGIADKTTIITTFNLTGK